MKHRVFKEKNSLGSFSRGKPGTPQVPWAAATAATMTNLHQLLCKLARAQSPEELMPLAGICSAPCVQHTAFINYGSTFFVDIRQSFISQPTPTFFFPKMPANEIAAQWHAVFSQETLAAPMTKSWALRNSMETQKSHKCSWETLGGLKKWNLS